MKLVKGVKNEEYHEINDSSSDQSKENLVMLEEKVDEFGWKTEGYNPEYVFIDKKQIVLKERGTSSEMLYFYIEKPFDSNRLCNLKLSLKGGTFYLGFITQAEKDILINFQNNPEPTVPQLQSKFKVLEDSEVEININMEKKQIELKSSIQIEPYNVNEDSLYMTLACQRENGKEKSVLLEYVQEVQKKKVWWFAKFW